jgi:phosphatidylserine/phosphatidylglycerophosphate/cardiolipin synthase-like enzyme
MKPDHSLLRLLGPILFACALGACSSASPDGSAPPAAEGPVVEQPAPEVPVAPGAEPVPVPAAVTPACSPLVPRTTPLEVSVLPDAGATPFVSVLGRATKTIRVMVYEMGTGPIIDTLEAKARAGVKVQIILDVAQMNTNQKYMDRLKAAGADVIWSDTRFQFMHAKLLIVDGAEAVISTGNYAAFRMTMERNFVVRDADAADVDVLVKLFDADFARKDPDLTCTRLLVSPVNAKQRLLDFIASAKTDVLVESMQLADNDVRDALAARKAAGATVRVLLADPSWITANADAAAFLASHGIEARHMKDPGVHVKAVVVDGKLAYAGSINLSWTSLTKNREVGLLITEPANVTAMHTTMTSDWLIATPF